MIEQCVIGHFQYKYENMLFYFTGSTSKIIEPGESVESAEPVDSGESERSVELVSDLDSIESEESEENEGE